MAPREAVIVQVGADHGRAELLGQPHDLGHAVRHHDAAAGQDHREPAPASSSVAAARLSGPPGPRSTRIGSRDRVVGLAVEQVARDVELGRAALEHGIVEAARQQLGDPRLLRAVDLVLGDLLEERQLLGLLESAQALRVGAGLGGDHHHRAVRPVGGGDRGHEVGDAGAVLGDADAVAAEARRSRRPCGRRPARAPPRRSGCRRPGTSRARPCRPSRRCRRRVSRPAPPGSRRTPRSTVIRVIRCLPCSCLPWRAS